MFGDYYIGERGYISMIQDVLTQGVNVPDRTGVGCKALFDAKVVYPNIEQIFPFSTVRPAPFRMAFEEFSMFLRGETQTKQLEDKGIYFWQPQTTREFLDNRGLHYVPEGNIHKAYSFQFRNFGGKKIYYENGPEINFGGVDQLTQVYESLRDNPYSRRHYISFWNPSQLDEMALPPCWYAHQFVVLPDDETGEDTLHLKLFNRSLDCVFGFSFAIQQYAFYQLAMAKMVNMKPGSLIADLSHIHIYENQLEYSNELVKRDFGEPGTLTINKKLNTLDDLINLKYEDFEINNLVVNRSQFKTPKPEMAI